MKKTFNLVNVSERYPETCAQYHTDKGYCKFDRFTKQFYLDDTKEFVKPLVWFEELKNEVILPKDFLTKMGWSKDSKGSFDFEGMASLLDKYRNEEFTFESLSTKILKYLNNNHHPHTIIVATTTNVQVFEGLKSTGEVLEHVLD